MKHITIFDKPYSKDKVAEGMAISEAIKHELKSVMPLLWL